MMVKWRNTTVALFLAAICSSIYPAYCDNEFLGRLGRKSQELMNKIIKRHLSDDEPGPIIVPNFITNEEAATILKRYEHLIRPSAHVMSAQVRSNDKYRTSKSVRLPPIGDPLVVDIEKRSADLAGFHQEHSEDFQLACYNDDELYGLHRDDADDQGGRARSANRAATVLIYLHSPDSGGETLFTRLPIEEERDLDSKQKLNTQDGALKLFRSYCNKPRKHHVVVPATVGTAVMWRNWYGNSTNSTDKFAARSTHGACPVKGGKKCVIQVWISKSSHSNPLRHRRVAAIFPSGADVSFQGMEGSGEGAVSGISILAKEKKCFKDTSARFGIEISEICFVPRSTDAQLVQLGMEDPNPYIGVGAWRIASGELQATLSANLRAAFTVSFWVRGLDEDTTILSIGADDFGDKDENVVRHEHNHNSNWFQAIVKKGEGAKKLIELSSNNNQTSTVGVENLDQWMWMSFSISQGGELNLHIYDKKYGRVLGQAAIQGQKQPEYGSLSFCLENDTAPYKMTLFSQPLRAANSDGSKVAFAPIKTVDLSFIIFHETVLSSPEISSLRQQVRRYDVKT